MNPTTDPGLRSFVAVPPDSHFPIQNLPFGVFSRPGGERRLGVAIGDFVLDLRALVDAGLLKGDHFRAATLNPFLALGRRAWSAARAEISRLLRHDEPALRDHATLREKALLPVADVTLYLPAEIGDYTDFYSSREHATNVGAMLRGPDNALMPNWVHLPVAYHGRASSVVVSGTPVVRPLGQTKPENAPAPVFGPSRALDFELELGFLVGPGNALGEPIPVEKAADHVFGAVLVNDWSARDLQKWEYQPLGPFLAKNFATSVSPWVVPLEALEPFRVVGPAQDPEPLPYLRSAGAWSYNIDLEVWLHAAGAERADRVSRSNSRHLYWNVCQQVAHHTVNGCNLRPGDLLATGTVSGPTPDALGCLLELTRGGKQPLTLSSGLRRSFLEDGDCVTLTGWCQGDGYRLGFGAVTGTVLPARG